VKPFRKLSALFFLCMLLFGVSSSLLVEAAPPTNFQRETVYSNLSQPIAMVFLPDDSILVLEKNGQISQGDPANPGDGPWGAHERTPAL